MQVTLGKPVKKQQQGIGLNAIGLMEAVKTGLSYGHFSGNLRVVDLPKY